MFSERILPASVENGMLLTEFEDRTRRIYLAVDFNAHACVCVGLSKFPSLILYCLPNQELQRC